MAAMTKISAQVSLVISGLVPTVTQGRDEVTAGRLMSARLADYAVFCAFFLVYSLSDGVAVEKKKKKGHDFPCYHNRIADFNLGRRHFALTLATQRPGRHQDVPVICAALA